MALLSFSMKMYAGRFRSAEAHRTDRTFLFQQSWYLLEAPHLLYSHAICSLNSVLHLHILSPTPWLTGPRAERCTYTWSPAKATRTVAAQTNWDKHSCSNTSTWNLWNSESFWWFFSSKCAFASVSGTGTVKTIANLTNQTTEKL